MTESIKTNNNLKYEEKILFVDDEENVLQAFKRNFYKIFNLSTALSGNEAIALINENEFAVVITDMRMPEMNGIELLDKIKDISPDTVRMMLTGYADIETTLNAVNQGNIFRFMTKPWPSDQLQRMIIAGIRQYRMIKTEKEILEKTLSGIIQLLNQILALTNPIAMDKTHRMYNYAKHIINKLNIEDSWQFEIASLLSQLGCINLSDDLILKQYKPKFKDFKAFDQFQYDMNSEEKELFLTHPEIGEHLLKSIPRMNIISKIIGNQFKTYNELKNDKLLSFNTIMIGAQILRICNDLDNAVLSGYTINEILTFMLDRPDTYNNYIVKQLFDFKDIERKYIIQEMKVSELSPSMITQDNVLSKNGIILVTKEIQLTPTSIEILRTYSKGAGVKEPIKVKVPI
ncbi:MAG: response regulator [Candidatus Cloacimonetes bacterium]|nr:response regulator [Candidatus Cloacimonadota bacterium]